jgi:ribosomal protein S12 methylthiotransferase
MSDSGKIGFVSLGCPKALVDSERILTQLRAEGYSIVPSYDEADLVVVNTCGFIDDAVAESMDAIGEALQENGKVIVTGCLGAREGMVETAYPNVLAVTGPHATEEVMQAIHTQVPAAHDPYTSLVPAQGIRLTPRHYAYLKISEGCNHRCSFCIIPSLRGDLVSRPVEEVMREAQALTQAGVRELMVIAQDTSAYGVDVKYRPGIWQGRALRSHITDLAAALGELDAWIRLHYVYPYPHVDQLIPLMREGLILPYLDVPLQHASPTILKAMRRPANSENALDRIKRWRDQCPELALRSTFIVGFPGETEADFEQLLTFIERAELDRVGCFAYSAVDGAKANALPGIVDEAVKQQRLQQFMELQAGISLRRNRQRIGDHTAVIIDEVTADNMLARSYAEAPEVDGNIILPPLEGLQPGDMIEVRIVDADAYDLQAEPC